MFIGQMKKLRAALRPYSQDCTALESQLAELNDYLASLHQQQASRSQQTVRAHDIMQKILQQGATQPPNDVVESMRPHSTW